MGISGSDLAPTQFRFNIGRFGATRFGYFHPYLRVILNGTNQADRIKPETIEILDRLHEEPNRCTFTLREGTAPTAGHSIVVSLGNATDYTRLFAGTIIDVQQDQVAFSQEVTYRVTALDYTWLLDKRLVTAEYRSQTADAIARDLIQTYTTGFTTNRVQHGLANVEAFPLTNVRLSTALTRLANLINGAWYVDEHQDVHFFLTETLYPTPPSLTTSNTKFWGLEAQTDLSQVRTRVLVEGMRTTCPIQIPAGGVGFPSSGGFITIPLEEASPFQFDATLSTTYLARLGTDRMTYASLTQISTDSPGTVAAADAAIGASSIEITTNPPGFGVPRWVRIGEQYVFVTSTLTSPNRLTGIPTSGVGSITIAIETGQAIEYPPCLMEVTPAHIRTTQPAGVEVVMYVQVDDTAAQTALAAIEGGDGIHEILVQDGRLNITGATARATAELAQLKAAITSISYKTRDTRTRSGRQITVSLPSPTSLSATLLIRDVTIDGFDELAPRTSHRVAVFPKRTVQAIPVRLGGVLDLLSSDEDGK